MQFIKIKKNEKKLFQARNIIYEENSYVSDKV